MSEEKPVEPITEDDDLDDFIVPPTPPEPWFDPEIMTRPQRMGPTGPLKEKKSDD